MKNILLSPDGADGNGPDAKQNEADKKTRAALNKREVKVRARSKVDKHGVFLDQGKEGVISAFQFDLLKDSLEKVALIMLMLFLVCCGAQVQTNLGLGMAIALPSGYGLAPATYIPATQTSNGCPALAYVPSGQVGTLFPLTNSIPSSFASSGQTNWLLGTNGQYASPSATSPSLLILNLTHWDEVLINVVFTSTTNAGGGGGSLGCTNWLFWAPSDDGVNFDTNHLVTMINVMPTNNPINGQASSLFRTNMTVTTSGSPGYYGLVGIGVQGTNTITNFQVIPVVKGRKNG